MGESKPGSLSVFPAHGAREGTAEQSGRFGAGDGRPAPAGESLGLCHERPPPAVAPEQRPGGARGAALDEVVGVDASLLGRPSLRPVHVVVEERSNG